MKDWHIRKERRSKYFWIMGTLGSIIIIWAMFFMPVTEYEKMQTDFNDTLSNSDKKTVPAEVSAYLDFVLVNNDTIDPAQTVKYASVGLEQLSYALESIVDRDYRDYHSFIRKNNELQETSEKLEKLDSKENAEEVKEALITVTELLESIQTNYYPDYNIREIEKAKQTAESLNEEIDLKKQLSNIRRFFNLTADIFRELSQSERQASFF